MKSLRSKEQAAKAGVTGFADHAGRLSAGQILIDGWCVPSHPEDDMVLVATTATGVSCQSAEIFWFDRADVPDGARGFAALLDTEWPGDTELDEILIGHASSPSSLPTSTTLSVSGNLVDRIFQLRRMLPETAWKELGDWIGSRAGHIDDIRDINDLAVGGHGNEDLNRFTARFVPAKPFMIDLCIRLDDEHFAIVGWTQLKRHKIASLEIVLGDSTTPILDRCQWFDRPDVSQHFGAGKGSEAGFAAFVRVPDAQHSSELAFRLTSSNGFARSLTQAIADDDPAVARRQLLSSFSDVDGIADNIFREYLAPSLDRLQPKLEQLNKIRQTVTCGPQPDSPEVSIIVPVYHGLEFVTQQIVQFASDPGMRQHELIYVLDSPESASSFKRAVVELSEFYDVSLKLLILRRNVGFSAANNVAAEHARGKYLCLLNQDVIPDQPGWLDAMLEFSEKTDDVACVGPKLLYEDHSIQHAGMYFRQIPTRGDSWYNMHYFKGLHRNFPEASERRAVPAVTAACLLVLRSLYEQVGGLDEGFVMGDYEDSDFCLKCATDGRQNYYLGDVELFHLERQSFGTLDTENWRRTAQAYNLWRQSTRWHETIESLQQA